MNFKLRAEAWSRHRLAGVLFVIFPVLLTGFVLRVVLTASVWKDLGSLVALPGAFIVGISQDLIYASYLAIPTILYLALVPQRVFASRFHRILSWLYFACIWWLVLFQAVSEWIFWDEFGVRLNFIAVDYLVYTTEVIDNILESYPVGKLFGAIAVLAVFANSMLCRGMVFRAWQGSKTGVRPRMIVSAAILSIPVLATAFVSQSDLPGFTNRYAQEIAKNGQYSFFAAFRNNDLPYRDFYDTVANPESLMRVQRLVDADRQGFVSSQRNPVRRSIRRTTFRYGQTSYRSRLKA
ncbi:MAG: hypothetical protein RLN69_06490 [Woeseiaceae bacterium]